MFRPYWKTNLSQIGQPEPALADIDNSQRATPSQTPCFQLTAATYHRGNTTFESYLDNHLAHAFVDGVHHEDDRSDVNLTELTTLDPVSGAFKAWILDPRFQAVEQKDAITLKTFFLTAWISGDIAKLQLLDEDLKASTNNQLSAFSTPILQVTLAVALARSHISLLVYLVSFAPPPETIFDIMDLSKIPTAYQNPEGWAIILDSSWIHRPAAAWHREGWMEILTTSLTSSSDCSSTNAEQFIKSLKTKGIQPTLIFFRNLINSLDPVNLQQLNLLLSQFPPSSIPAESFSSPFSTAKSLPRIVSLSNNPSRREIMRLLLDAGLDPNWMHTPKTARQPTSLADMDRQIAEAYGNTDHEAPLHVAAERGELEMVTLLLQRGAKKDLKDGLGRTPEGRAKKMGRREVCTVLENWNGPDAGLGWLRAALWM